MYESMYLHTYMHKSYIYIYAHTGADTEHTQLEMWCIWHTLRCVAYASHLSFSIKSLVLFTRSLALPAFVLSFVEPLVQRHSQQDAHAQGHSLVRQSVAIAVDELLDAVHSVHAVEHQRHHKTQKCPEILLQSVGQLHMCRHVRLVDVTHMCSYKAYKHMCLYMWLRGIQAWTNARDSRLWS